MDLWDKIEPDKSNVYHDKFFYKTRSLLLRFEYHETRVDLENSLDGLKRITSLISSSIDEDLSRIREGAEGKKRPLKRDARGLFSDYLHSSIVANSKPLKHKFTNLFMELSELLDIQFESPKPVTGRGNPNFKASRLTDEQMKVIINVANELIEKRPDLIPHLNKKNKHVISAKLYNKIADELPDFEPKRIRRNLLKRATFNGTYFIPNEKISLLIDM